MSKSVCSVSGIVSLGMCVLFFLTSLEKVSAQESERGFVFGVRPGGISSSGYIGLNRDPFIPFAGLDFIAINVNFDVVGRDDVIGVDASVSLLWPYVGVKYFLSQQSLRPYLTASVFRGLSFGSSKYTGRLSADEAMLKEDIEDASKSFLNNLTGLLLGGGVEYQVSNRFSIGGEYGIRLLFGGVDQRLRIDEDEELFLDASLNMKSLYAAITANFYF